MRPDLFNQSSFHFPIVIQFGLYGCIPEVHMVLLTPIMSYKHLSYGVFESAISVIYAIYVIHDIYDIVHIKVSYMTIWGSKEPYGPQGYSHQVQIGLVSILSDKNFKNPPTPNFLCIFLNFLCIIQIQFQNSKRCRKTLKT